MKATCDELKRVRHDIAQRLDIKLEDFECQNKDNCQGTCERCRKEEEILNKALQENGFNISLDDYIAMELNFLNNCILGEISEA